MGKRGSALPVSQTLVKPDSYYERRASAMADNAELPYWADNFGKDNSQYYEGGYKQLAYSSKFCVLT